MRQTKPCIPVFIVVSVMLVINKQAMADERLADRDVTVIAQAYHLWESLGEQVWPGWTDTPMPMLYIADDHEFAIGFGSALNGFAGLDQTIADRQLQLRPRQFEPTLAASFDFEGIPAVIIGTPANLQWSPTEWTLKAVHEMYHVMSSRRGSAVKIANLQIGPSDDASWQLEFPFPYDDVDVMRLMHLQGYPLFLALNAEIDADAKYNAGACLEAHAVLETFLRNATGDDRAAHYAQFQEGEEGVARYTEHRLAQLAAEAEYEPLAAFRDIEGSTSYATIWSESYATAPFVIKHAGRAVKSRTLFYYLGLGKALLLDRIKPDWKDSFFAPDVWIDDLIAQAVGSQTVLTQVAPGQLASEFALQSLAGSSVDLDSLYGKVVLLDFWQWWCPPCVAAMPHLQELHDTFADRGLVILGVSDRVDDAAGVRMQKLAGDLGVTYPMLIDPDSQTTRAFGVNRYPTLILIDQQGVIRHTYDGFPAGTESELRQHITDLIQR